MPKVYTERSRSEIATKNKNGFTPTPKNFGVGARYKCLPVQILNGKICSGTACLPAEALTKEGGDEIFWNTHKKFTYRGNERLFCVLPCNNISKSAKI